MPQPELLQDCEGTAPGSVHITCLKTSDSLDGAMRRLDLEDVVRVVIIATLLMSLLVLKATHVLRRKGGIATVIQNPADGL